MAELGLEDTTLLGLSLRAVNSLCEPCFRKLVDVKDKLEKQGEGAQNPTKKKEGPKKSDDATHDVEPEVQAEDESEKKDTENKEPDSNKGDGEFSEKLADNPLLLLCDSCLYEVSSCSSSISRVADEWFPILSKPLLLWEEELLGEDRLGRYKTSMCEFFLHNKCRKGYNCTYAHSTAELSEFKQMENESRKRAKEAPLPEEDRAFRQRCQDVGVKYWHSDTREITEIEVPRWAVRAVKGNNLRDIHNIEKDTNTFIKIDPAGKGQVKGKLADRKTAIEMILSLLPSNGGSISDEANESGGNGGGGGGGTAANDNGDNPPSDGQPARRAPDTLQTDETTSQGPQAKPEEGVNPEAPQQQQQQQQQQQEENVDSAGKVENQGPTASSIQLQSKKTITLVKRKRDGPNNNNPNNNNNNTSGNSDENPPSKVQATNNSSDGEKKNAANEGGEEEAYYGDEHYDEEYYDEGDYGEGDYEYEGTEGAGGDETGENVHPEVEDESKEGLSGSARGATRSRGRGRANTTKSLGAGAKRTTQNATTKK